MSRRVEEDREGGQWLLGERAQGAGNGPIAGVAQEGQRGIAQIGEQAWSLASADCGGILANHHIFDIVQGIFNLPMPPPQGEQAGRVSNGWR